MSRPFRELPAHILSTYSLPFLHTNLQSRHVSFLMSSTNVLCWSVPLDLKQSSLFLPTNLSPQASLFKFCFSHEKLPVLKILDPTIFSCAYTLLQCFLGCLNYPFDCSCCPLECQNQSRCLSHCLNQHLPSH